MAGIDGDDPRIEIFFRNAADSTFANVGLEIFAMSA